MNKQEWRALLLKSVARVARREAVTVKRLLKPDNRKCN